MNRTMTTKLTSSSFQLMNSSCRRYCFVAMLVFVPIVLLSTAYAVSPAPDGGYPNGNTAEGNYALADLSSGANNTAVGAGALFSDFTGNNNTALGEEALFYNTASSNTATGYQALFSNRSGTENTATGVEALSNNTTGSQNTAIGVRALHLNSTANGNTAACWEAISRNTTGNDNTATGFEALYNNTIGTDNTAGGFQALFKNTTGNNNTASGKGALANNTTGGNNVALGLGAGSNLTTGSNNIIIGTNVVGNSSDAYITRIGSSTQKKTFIGGISGKTVANGVGVIINGNGQLGTVQSSARYKTAIKPMDKASEALLALKPVTFRYKEELDPDKIPQFGLIAEEVEKIDSDLVVRDEEGKVSTVRYEAVNAMLLNEFLKEHRKVQEQAATIEEMKRQMEGLAKGLRVVTDQIEISGSAPW